VIETQAVVGHAIKGRGLKPLDPVDTGVMRPPIVGEGEENVRPLGRRSGADSEHQKQQRQ